MRIVEGGFDDARVIALLRLHMARAHAETAPGSAHALDVAGLKAADIRFWSAWRGDELLGCGALKRLSPQHGEVKSMHVAEVARGRGVGGALLDHIVAEAKAARMTRLSLETGSWPYFAPAVALYRSRGFEPCGPFGAYVADPNSLFLSLDLSA